MNVRLISEGRKKNIQCAVLIHLRFEMLDNIERWKLILIRGNNEVEKSAFSVRAVIISRNFIFKKILLCIRFKD